MIATTYGPLFWLNTGQSYLLLIFATYKLIHHLLTTTDSNLYRSQINLMLLGLAAPWLANFITLAGLSPFDHLDLTPFAFTLTGLALGIGLFRYKLLDVTPVARHLLVQQLPEGVMVLDSRLRIVDINPALRRLIPGLPNEPHGRSLEEIFSHRPDLLTQFWATEDSKFEAELANTSYAVHLTMLRSNTQQLGGKLAVFIDISKQKEAEAYLRTARSAAESAQEQAAAAEAMAKATAQAKDNFLTTMSHEIRTPINAIVGTGQLLRDTPLTSEQKELLNTIQHSSDELLGIINNILDYSLLEAGNLSLSLRPFSLTACINSVFQSLEPTAQQKNLSLTQKIQSDLPEFFDGDPVRLRQILFNLLHNSIKFSEEGAITLEVTGVETAVDLFQLQFPSSTRESGSLRPNWTNFSNPSTKSITLSPAHKAAWDWAWPFPTVYVG
jgi:signal transduction histidine kinase